MLVDLIDAQILTLHLEVPSAQGGRIWNSDCGMGPPALALIDSAVTHNSLTASSGIAVQGGGVFNTGTLTLTNSVISGNSPDQCVGC